ncbi:hypothetical protein HFO93_29410 [Rhizobium leguminosarum]|uniref:Uncharacterized protein n=1 Tax=Rhizobium leguminosarum TaxID=384 RepID=A0A4Q8XPK6_RHILE|nr:invasion associated locus B family protein [Rhizobium leguminosarum]MBY5371114.1 hypothetical protein [Rhizobium leguminosarum]MBY5447489.1 hypothetical protein [Rhizobium leguminosarum]TAX22905.1 hypothetical protein ELI04_33615 [Rhizobium leguminosarum]TAX45740.1 hypothetical protein ELI02_28860 [Rhizobium leguminosarum]TAX46543.1 hypothetical protein ELI01_30700 [Rhizobium leguminosarum]
MKRLMFALILTHLTTGTANAQPVMLKQFGDWGAYSYRDGTKTLCYILTTPVTSEPPNVDHGKNYFIVGPGPDPLIKYEPQAQMGYQLKDDSRIKLDIGDKTFWLFSRGNRAWMQNETREPELVDAMRAGSDMVLSATSKRGTATRYSFSLSGVTAALKRIAKCQ